MSGDRGSPDPVLLLHGQPGGARDWDRVVAALGGRVRAIVNDRPGWDRSSEPRDLQGNAEAAVAALDAAEVERATLAGHSFGAAVACWVALEHPERVSGLVLVAPAANVASLYVADRVLAAPIVGALGSALIVGGPALALRTGWTRRLVAGALELGEDQLRETGRVLAGRSAWRAFSVEQRSLVRDLPRLESRLAAIASPTVVLAGERDRIVPAASTRRLANQIPGSQLVVVPRAGHLLPFRRSERIAAAILDGS